MSFDEPSAHSICIASLVQGSLCPETGAIFSFLNFHTSAFKTFTSAVFGHLLLIFLLAALFLVLTVLFFKLKTSPIPTAFSVYFRRRLSELLFLIASGFIDWWALHEKRDPSLCLAL